MLRLTILAKLNDVRSAFSFWYDPVWYSLSKNKYQFTDIHYQGAIHLRC